jgi:glycine dehydrogenase subunit 1
MPKSPADRAALLQAIGARSIDDLFSPIPAEYRLNRELKIPRPMAESEIVDWFRERSRENGDGYATFLGAGAYHHYRPVIIDALISRGEFLTAYTPYQPEVSQGTLQSIFEFQTMICELTGMEVANASMYDGSTGAAEGVMMAVRLTGKNRAAVARSLHPEYCEVLATYARQQGMPLDLVPFTDTGRLDLKALNNTITDDTACVLIQNPNFFGTIEDIEAVAEVAHNRGTLLVVSIAEAVSLGIVEPPRQADVKPNPSESRSASAVPTAESLPPARNMFVRCPAALSARPPIATANAASFLLSPLANSTSVARKRPPTSAPIRRWSR